VSMKKLIGEGRTAEIWEYGDQTVVKLYREDASEQQAVREYEISKYAHAQGIRTPLPMERITIGDRNGIVFQQVAGGSLLGAMAREPRRIGEYAARLAGLHADLHKLEAPGDIGRQKEMLRRGIVAAPMLTMDEKSDILACLEKLPEGNKLCHGDMHPDNVLMDGQLWVIDWMTGTVGEPAGDVARSLIMFSIGSMPPGTSIPARLMMGFMRKRLTRNYIREYLSQSGRSYAEINRWVLPVAAARLVESVPLQEKEQLVKEIRRRLRSAAAGK